jgi:hypothetical protein
MQEQEFFTVAEVAKLLKVSPDAADEIFSTKSPARREALLSRFGRLLYSAQCLWPPHEIIRLLVEAHRGIEPMDYWKGRNRPVPTSKMSGRKRPKEFPMVTRIWNGATPAAKSDEYLNLKRTVAIPDYRSTPGNKGAYALRRIEGDTAHFLMVTFWESEEAIRAFAGDDISLAKYYDFDKDFLIEMESCSTHYEMYDN